MSAVGIFQSYVNNLLEEREQENDQPPPREPESPAAETLTPVLDEPRQRRGRRVRIVRRAETLTPAWDEPRHGCG